MLNFLKLNILNTLMMKTHWFIIYTEYMTILQTIWQFVGCFFFFFWLCTQPVGLQFPAWAPAFTTVKALRPNHREKCQAGDSLGHLFMLAHVNKTSLAHSHKNSCFISYRHIPHHHPPVPNQSFIIHTFMYTYTDLLIQRHLLSSSTYQRHS